MTHLYFLIWMLMFPVCDKVGDYIQALVEEKRNDVEKYDSATKGFASLINLGMWFFIGYLLY
jgi:hypothetical protein